MKKAIAYIMLAFAVSLCFGQSKFEMPNESSRKIRFQLLNNLIVVPVQLNGVELSFLLDTGVSKTILFDIGNNDSLTFNNTEILKLRGLGDKGSIEAIKSNGNQLKFGDAINNNHSVYGVFDQNLNFTPRLGVPVHGILGYDLFKDFIVEISYSANYVRLYKPSSAVEFSKKWEAIPIELYRKKPYLKATVEGLNGSMDVKLLIDTGGSDALWLFENEAQGIFPDPDLQFNDYLGKGLSGSIYGKRSKINHLKLGSFTHDAVNVSYPDSVCVGIAKTHKERNGSISGNILKRYNLIINYPESQLLIRKNKYFNEPFTYNNSGLVVEQRGIRIVKEYKKERVQDFAISSGNDFKNATITEATVAHYLLKPSFDIVEVRQGSNAELAGLKVGDQLTMINGKPTHQMKLQELIKILHGSSGETIRIRINRAGIDKLFKFEMDNVFQKKDPQINEGL